MLILEDRLLGKCERGYQNESCNCKNSFHIAIRIQKVLCNFAAKKIMQKYIKYTLFIILTVFLLKIIISHIEDRPRFPENCLKKEFIFKAIDGDTLQLALYSPIDTLSARQTVIYFHGGTWISGNKDKVFQRYRSDACKMLLDNHINIVSADYRLINLSGNHLQDCLQDCHDAIRFCINNHKEMGIDTGRMALWGSSSGSHLAMLCCGKHDSDRDSNFRHIKFIINDFGPTDICRMWQRTPEWFRRKASPYFYGANVQNISVFDSLSTAYSPISYTEELRKFPMLISQGMADRIVNSHQSSSLHDSLPESQFLNFDNLGHGFSGMDDKQKALYLEKFKNYILEY